PDMPTAGARRGDRGRRSRGPARTAEGIRRRRRASAGHRLVTSAARRRLTFSPRSARFQTMDAPLLTAKDAIELSDGRRLSYSATGRPGGIPVLYFHGAIGSPPQADDALDGAIRDLGVRYLMLDRPGFGGSDSMPGRRGAGLFPGGAGVPQRLRLHRCSL